MHSCPVCDQACYCSGSIDDCEIVEDDLICLHCIDDDDEEDYDGTDEDWL